MNKKKVNKTPITKIFCGIEEIKKGYELMLTLNNKEIYTFVDQENTPSRVESVD
jgi:hypothetical protein